MALHEISSSKCFGGYQKVFKHYSEELKCEATFSVFVPPQKNFDQTHKWPVLYWLSGLTCTEANFIQKSGFQRYAAEAGILVVGPDTSPRGCQIEGEDDSWDFGSGAGFYVDATTEKWKCNYRMYSYVTKELPKVIAGNLPVDFSRQSISGHSMGGHGALICYLKNPGMYKSVSAFAPICNPSLSPWGIKNFTGYLGPHSEKWNEYDSVELVKLSDVSKFSSNEIRIEQGGNDEHLQERLLPYNFLPVAKEAGFVVDYRLRESYDHSYYFVSTFIGEHIWYHAKYLGCQLWRASENP